MTCNTIARSAQANGIGVDGNGGEGGYELGDVAGQGRRNNDGVNRNRLGTWWRAKDRNIRKVELRSVD